MFYNVLGLRCWRAVFLLGVQGLLLLQGVDCRASAATAHELSSCSSWFPGTGSAVVEHRPSCPSACGILLHQDRTYLCIVNNSYTTSLRKPPNFIETEPYQYVLVCDWLLLSTLWVIHIAQLWLFHCRHSIHFMNIFHYPFK